MILTGPLKMKKLFESQPKTIEKFTMIIIIAVIAVIHTLVKMKSQHTKSTEKRMSVVSDVPKKQYKKSSKLNNEKKSKITKNNTKVS